MKNAFHITGAAEPWIRADKLMADSQMLPHGDFCGRA